MLIVKGLGFVLGTWVLLVMFLHDPSNVILPEWLLPSSGLNEQSTNSAPRAAAANALAQPKFGCHAMLCRDLSQHHQHSSSLCNSPCTRRIIDSFPPFSRCDEPCEWGKGLMLMWGCNAAHPEARGFVSFSTARCNLCRAGFTSAFCFAFANVPLRWTTSAFCCVVCLL